MSENKLGKIYNDGEIIVKEGEIGNCMYVIQKGMVEIFCRKNKKEVKLSTLKEGDFFGEMALFAAENRSATVKACGEVIALTIDKKMLLKNIQRDPTLAFNLIEKLSERIVVQNSLISRIMAADRRNWYTRPEQLREEIS